MTIPASQLVDITSRTIGGGLSGIELNGVFLTRNSTLPTNNIMIVYSADQVSEYFGAQSSEYELAQNYFLADDNKQKTPSALYFWRMTDDSAAAAFIRGARMTLTLSQLKAITDGALKIGINGTEISLTGISFAEVTSFSQAASVLQQEIQKTSAGSTASYSSQFGAFVIVSGTTGAESTISYAAESESGSDLGQLLNLTQNTGAVLSQGADVVTLSASLGNMTASFQNFFSVMPVFQENEEEGLEIASWISAQGTKFAYFYNETSAVALVPNNAACFAQQVKTYNGIFSGYNTKNFCAFMMGVCASTDYNRLRGRKTGAFRTQAGLSPTVDNGSNSLALLGNGYNFYGAYASASQDFVMSYNGSISGSVKWLDTYEGQVWLKSALQAAWLSVMQANNTLPFNEDGYGAIRSASLDPINSAVNAGIIVPRVTLSNLQKATVNAEAGEDISEALYTQGWFLQIPDASAQVRSDRGPLSPNFWYCDGGSIQRIQGTSTTIL